MGVASKDAKPEFEGKTSAIVAKRIQGRNQGLMLAILSSGVGTLPTPSFCPAKLSLTGYLLGT